MDMDCDLEDAMKKLITTRPFVVAQLVILVMIYTRTATIEFPDPARLGPNGEILRAGFALANIIMLLLIFIWLELVSLGQE